MNCRLFPLDLTLAREFIVAGGRARHKRNYIVVLDEIGLGEAAGSVHYGSSPEKMEKDLSDCLRTINDDLHLDQLDEYLDSLEGGICAPAMCALSTARQDLYGKWHNQGIHTRFDLPSPRKLKTSVTVSVGDAAAIRQWVEAGYDIIKIKMDANANDGRKAIEFIHKYPQAVFRIDANGSWSYDYAADVVSRLPAERIEMIEQPFAADAREDWLRLREKTSIPLIMDETIESTDDIEKAADYIDGVNIKIQKSGRLKCAVQAMKTARAKKLKIMLGCMIESSVGIAAARQLSGLADYIDLDGRLLIEDDPFAGLDYAQGKPKAKDKYGHGVSLA